MYGMFLDSSFYVCMVERKKKEIGIKTVRGYNSVERRGQTPQFSC